MCIRDRERVQPNKKQIEKELENNWGILAEAIQTILRKNGDKKAYQKIKRATRGHELNKEKYLELVNNLEITAEDKKVLVDLSPLTYLGEIEKILKKY